MKFTITANALKGLLDVTATCVHTHAVLPILSHVLLQRDGATLHGSTTNLDARLSATAEVTDPVGKFELCLPHDSLSRIAQLARGPLELELEERGVLHITSCNSHYKLNGLAPKEFPPAPALNHTSSVAAPASELRAMLRTMLRRCSTDISRAALCGVHIQADGEGLRLTASDGRRLATGRVPLADWSAAMPKGGITLPSGLLKMVMPALGAASAEDQVRLWFPEQIEDNSTVRLEIGARTQCILKLENTPYPDVQGVVSTVRWDQATPVSSELWAGALRRAAPMLGASNTVVIRREGFTAELANDEADGQFREQLPSAGVPVDLNLRLNAQYLTDAVDVSLISDSAMQLVINKATEPVGVAIPSLGYREIIMTQRPA